MGDEAITSQPRPSRHDLPVQQRQDWYAEYARTTGQARLAFVGALSADVPVNDAARAMAEALDYGTEARGATWATR